MKIHELKAWPVFFQQVREGRKPFEIRLDDRRYAIGDRIWLREYEPTSKCYTGREITVEILSILDLGAFFTTMGEKVFHDSFFGKEPSWVVMGTKVV